MAFKDFIHNIGTFFSDLFNGAQRAWDHLEPEVQNAMIHGSAIMDIINNNIAVEAPVVIGLFKSKFPDLTQEQLTAGIAAISKALNIAEGIDTADLVALVKNLQAYIATLQGDTWANISGTIAKALAIFFAPAGTRFAMIAALMEFCYQRFIRHNNAASLHEYKMARAA